MDREKEELLQDILARFLHQNSEEEVHKVDGRKIETSTIIANDLNNTIIKERFALSCGHIAQPFGKCVWFECGNLVCQNCYKTCDAVGCNRSLCKEHWADLDGKIRCPEHIGFAKSVYAAKRLFRLFKRG